MPEKELRIALVCFGGVSLAVYMHGVTKEILKLARASAALHSITDRTKRSRSTFFDTRDPTDPEYDTEPFYFDLLREICRNLELRVVVDIVAGASAGGINGVMLARALSHDLPMGRLRDLWLQNADVTELLAPEAKARGWSKWFLRPFFWVAGMTGLELIKDLEVRSKLSLFMRSRWFKPPLDGRKMAALMYDAVMAMGTPRERTSSLLPSGQRLDLFVTLTDFYGCQQLMQIHDPPVIHEREHRHVLHFKYWRRASGAVESDFDPDNAAALAFAARATSSIPGAFPPAQVLEIDRLIGERSVAWPRRQQFLVENFQSYAQMNVDVASVPFIDGSVLNSRPFREAVTAIHGRPAYRAVDRRVIYIDPNPATPGNVAHRGVPGFFGTLKGALSDIPLAEPIKDELDWIAAFNERVRRLRRIVDGARPHIEKLVAEVMVPGADQPISEEQIRTWRTQANSKATHDAGFAYEGYVRLKLASARSFISKIISEIRGVRPNSPFARAIEEIIDQWAIQAGASYEPSGIQFLQGEAAPETAPRWVSLLLAFDVDYRKRRLQFLIEGQNRIYQLLSSKPFDGFNPALIDDLKRKLYDHVEALERRETAPALNPKMVNLVEETFRSAPSPLEIREIDNFAQSFAAQHKTRIDMLVEQLASSIDLQSSTREIDLLLAGLEKWPPDVLHEVLVNYLGFAFWDVLTFPVTPWREIGEFNEIRVDRISGQDASTVGRLGEFQLKGTAFNQFAAFLSRAYRENDYLLGRLHAVDRLFEIVCDSAGPDAPSRAAMSMIRKNAIRRILELEAPHLPACKAVVEMLQTTLSTI